MSDTHIQDSTSHYRQGDYVSMGIHLDLHPGIMFAITMGTSVILFMVIRLLLNVLYTSTLVRWSSFNRYVEKTRRRGLPLIARYGSIGLVAFVAVPFPTTGVCAATLLSWLLGIKWNVSLIAILPGAAISNGIIALSAFGIMQGMNLTAG